MSTEVIGIFDSRETAEKAEKSLRDSGFSSSAIVVQSHDYAGAKENDHYAQALTHGETLVAVTSSDNVSEDKALSVLRKSGAIKINEITNRFHADQHDAGPLVSPKTAG